jgi:hypothetical protein
MALADYPLSNDKSANGLPQNATDQIQVCGRTDGLKPESHTDTITIRSDGGAIDVNVSLTSTVLNLNGRWIGALVRSSSALLASPTLGLDITQTGSDLSAQIDGRLSPAFATSIKKQAGIVTFERIAGSLAAGRMSVLAVDDGPTVEIWTFTSQGADTFEVKGSTTGPQGTASVGTRFDSKAGGIGIEILPSLNGHPYQKGDMFEFQVGHYGFAGPPLTGSLANGIAGTFSLDGPLLHLPTGSTRVFRISHFTIDDSGVLTADFELRYHGITPNDIVISDKLRLIRQP